MSCYYWFGKVVAACPSSSVTNGLIRVDGEEKLDENEGEVLKKIYILNCMKRRGVPCICHTYDFLFPCSISQETYLIAASFSFCKCCKRVYGSTTCYIERKNNVQSFVKNEDINYPYEPPPLIIRMMRKIFRSNYL